MPTKIDLQDTPFKNIGAGLYGWSVILNDAFYGEVKKVLDGDGKKKLNRLQSKNLFLFSAIGAYVAIKMTKSNYPQTMNEFNENELKKAIAEDVIFVMNLMAKKQLSKKLQKNFQDLILEYYKGIEMEENPYELFAHHLITTEFASKSITNENIIEIIDFSIKELKMIIILKPLIDDEKEEKHKDKAKFKVKSGHLFNIEGELIDMADSCEVDIKILNKHRSLSGQELLCKVSGSGSNLWDFNERYKLMKKMFENKIS